MIIWLEIIVRDLRSARTIDMDLVESLILSKWRKKVTQMDFESETTDSTLLYLTYWILKAQDSTNQNLSEPMMHSLEIVCNPISRWIDSPYQKVILETIEMWFRLSNQSSDVITLDILEFIIHMVGKRFEPKVCMSILVDFSWNCDNISLRTPLVSVDFVRQLLKYAVLATETHEDPLELSLISVEILVSLADRQSTDFIAVFGKFIVITDCIESINARDIIEKESINHDLHLFLLDILEPHMCQQQDVIL